MPITASKTGVWILDDTYKKILNSCWNLSGSPTDDQTLWAWGANAAGNLGNNTRTPASSPIQIPGTKWSAITTSSSYTSFALKSDNTFWGWGDNFVGKIGDNTTTYRSSPVQIPGTSWSQITAGPLMTAALKSDGTLWTWGRGYRGILGTSEGDIRRSSPAQVPGTAWCSVSHKTYHTLALKTDGTLWAWGHAYKGRLGNGQGSAYACETSPIQVPGSSWSAVSAAGETSYALKTDGTLWAWGGNFSGQLGINLRFYTSPSGTRGCCSPVQIPGTSWTSVSGSSGGTSGMALATKSDGTLWAWGSASYGKLGTNTAYNVPISSPTQIPGTSWSTPLKDNNAGFNNMFVRKTDGTLWGWGIGRCGQLGTNTSPTVNVSSPVQIPGAWSDVGSAHCHTLAKKFA